MTTAAHREFSDLSIAVIIPAYNRRDTLLEALGSVIAQSFAPAEIIVVDDGSTDGTPQLVATNFPDVRCIVQPNMGSAAARNAGIASASSEWVAFLDADDLWHPDRLQRLATAVKKDHRSDLIATDYELLPISEPVDFMCRGPLPDLNTIRSTEITTSDLLRHHQFGIAVIARRQALLEVGGFSLMPSSAEDWLTWLVFSLRHRITKLEDYTYLYRQRSGSLSRTSNIEASALAGLIAITVGRQTHTGRGMLSELDIENHWELLHRMVAGAVRDHDPHLVRASRHLGLLMSRRLNSSLRVRYLIRRKQLGHLVRRHLLAPHSCTERLGPKK